MKTIKLLCLMMIISSLSYSQVPKGVNANKVIDNTSKAVEKVYSDGTNAVSTVYNDVKSLTPKVEAALKSIGTDLKVGTNAVWNILVKQQLVWSWCFLILTLTSITNWFLFYKANIGPKSTELIDITVKHYNDDKYGDRKIKDESLEKKYISKNPMDAVMIIHLFICITLSIFSFINFQAMLTGFINPEFGAMKTIAEIASLIK